MITGMILVDIYFALASPDRKPMVFPWPAREYFFDAVAVAYI
jgi:hypothetical protein